MTACIVRWLKPEFSDPAGARIANSAQHLLGISTGTIRTARVYRMSRQLSSEQLKKLAESGVRDSILHEVSLDGLPELPGYPAGILVARRPGVTDDEGMSLQRLMADMLDMPFTGVQEVFTQDYYYLGKDLPKTDMQRLADTLLANPLIHHVETGPAPAQLNYLPEVHLAVDLRVGTIDLGGDDDSLLKLSKTRLLALNLEEMKTIRDFFSRQQVVEYRRQAGYPELPTDAELEILAQTWSEHCKHKEFAARIHFSDHDSGQETEIDSLFKTYIRGATERIQVEHARFNTDWLVKVFNDNAGVVKVDDRRLFVWKVETHNSPSALDPYGGALTGIVGVNRDPMGTGRGGARLLFNTDVLCFAPPDYAGELFPGQLSPLRIMSGVRQGIEDGGNKSGIPTINGSVIFDDRYRAKPLVFCGTAGVLPADWQGRASWEKEIAPGDLIVMSGGRVGKDGIHGATFSSAELDEHSPATAVQIGSPITQKFMNDFLEAALNQGLIKCCTDNGAGGLSSSIGELATISGGAEVDLAEVPLKYPGLKPWEIFVSESQERMTLVVAPDNWPKLEELARFYETEVSAIGRFTDDGELRVTFGSQKVALLPLEFLHDGVPRKQLAAEWRTPKSRALQPVPFGLEYGSILRRLLRRWNICSRESIIRQYDHEVKGRTVIKPLMGPRGIAPQDAAVMRFDFDDYVGVAVSNGICPRYGDLDPYEMSAGAFDEAVRSIIAVGGRLPYRDRRDDCFWSVNDNFCVPDSVYDARTNPDGCEKLGKLVKMCQALHNLSVFYGIPMTSGKDSMKNDARHGKLKVSVPPTVLYSMAARIDDVRQVTTAEFKKAGDRILVVGQVYDELGGSEFAGELGLTGGHVPKVRAPAARLRYEIMSELQSRGLIVSCHDISDGGLAVALAESAFGGCLGAKVTLPGRGFSTAVELFAESHSRFVISVAPEHLAEVQAAFANDVIELGEVSAEQILCITHKGKPVLSETIADLFAAWNRTLEEGGRA